MSDCATEPVVRLDHVGVVFGHGPHRLEALRAVTLELRPGELVAVTGRSGSGKSSLLNVAGGLVEASTGTVTVCGEHITGSTARRRAAIRRAHLGYVFQDLNLLPSLTVTENVSLPVELAGRSRHDGEADARAVLERMGLGDLGDRFPDQLSGGQRQRVAIARGLVGQRSVLLADEPTSALDDLSGEEVMRLIRQECDRGTAALVVTHEPALAAWADRVIRLRALDGRADGSIESESVRPANRLDLSDLAGFAEPTP